MEQYLIQKICIANEQPKQEYFFDVRMKSLTVWSSDSSWIGRNKLMIYSVKVYTGRC